ncbi:MAG TPA: tripartite tricarboxylate transporter substrate binding protein [Ramlibacter sp.]|nr:tripartite tricarboxylate transporter substrate binding protein [Ramlibacter sp.]
MLNRRNLLRALGCAAVVSAQVAPAVAQDAFPSRPVRLLVGAVPGGAPDVIARMLGEKLSTLLGQQFYVENRPGAGGTVVPGQLAKLPADGYTLLVADIGQLVIVPHLNPATTTFDPVKDFAPIARVAITPMFLVANTKSSQMRNLSDLVSQAKSRPGGLSYGSSGVGSIHHIAMEVFKKGTGLDIVHVPFKGSGQAVPAMLAGEVPFVVATLPTVGAFVQNGQAKLLATTAARRFSDAPDVPAISETVKGYDFASEIGFLAPAGTLPEVVARLAQAIRTVMDSPEIRGRFKVLGSQPAFAGPAEYTQNIQANFRKYGEAIKASNIKPN